jgi:hypothetical protein
MDDRERLRKAIDDVENTETCLDIYDRALARAECAAEIAAAVKRTENQARQEIAAILNNQNPPQVESLIFDPITVRVGMLHYPEKTIAAERKG